MRTDSGTWLPSGKGVADNIVANAVTTIALSAVGAAFTWWADLGLTRLGTLLVFAALMIAFAIVWVLVALGWRILYPAPKTDQTAQKLARAAAEALEAVR